MNAFVNRRFHGERRTAATLGTPTCSGLCAMLARADWPMHVALALLPLLAGCQPSWYRQNADRTASGLIAVQQVKAFGQTEPFTIETPADTLRRRLMIGQDLQYSGPASLGSDMLPIIPHWPEAPPPVPFIEPVTESLMLTLNDALQVAAANNRDYQTRKEEVFTSALALDLELNEFRNLFFGAMDTTYTADLDGGDVFHGFENTSTARWTRRLKNGAELTARIGLDLVQLLGPQRQFSRGIIADASIAVPLLRGAGEYIVTEPLTQAQRDVVYSLYSLERFKSTLAVGVASDYLSVLQQQDQVRNAEENYRQLIKAATRARRLADSGRLPEIQVDQATQDELRARDRWIIALQGYERQLDSFKTTLGLPTDALIELDPAELDRLAAIAQERLTAEGEEPTTAPATADTQYAQSMPVTQTATGPDGQPTTMSVDLVPPSRIGGGPLEMEPTEAIGIALEHRLDLRTAQGLVYDAQRRVVVAADALKAGLTLTASGSIGSGRSLGSAGADNANLRLDEGVYTAGLLLDLPLERTAEQDAYRRSYITLERSVRNVQDLEDQIKLEIRNALRTLVQARESYRIQDQAVVLAERRVASTVLFLQAGRAEIRDVLDAQESLVSAQDARTAALVDYRVAELELQRDMDVLKIDEKGLWSEYQPHIEQQ